MESFTILFNCEVTRTNIEGVYMVRLTLKYRVHLYEKYISCFLTTHRY